MDILNDMGVSKLFKVNYSFNYHLTKTLLEDI